MTHGRSGRRAHSALCCLKSLKGRGGVKMVAHVRASAGGTSSEMAAGGFSVRFCEWRAGAMRTCGPVSRRADLISPAPPAAFPPRLSQRPHSSASAILCLHIFLLISIGLSNVFFLSSSLLLFFSGCGKKGSSVGRMWTCIWAERGIEAALSPQGLL